LPLTIARGNVRFVHYNAACTSRAEEIFVPDIGGTSYQTAVYRLMVVIAGIAGHAEVGT